MDYIISPLDEIDLKKEVINILYSFGIPLNLKGYHYLVSAILMCIKNLEIQITKQIYPEIAKQYATTSNCVERAIRHAIKVAWKRANPSIIQIYFNSIYASKDIKPSNFEFISTIADKLKIELQIDKI